MIVHAALVPTLLDQDVHFVLCDYGVLGLAYVETDLAEANASTMGRVYRTEIGR